MPNLTRHFNHGAKAPRPVQPRSRPWTIEGLAAVRILIGVGTSLGATAEAVGRGRADVDVALWALVGRTPEEAVVQLNSPPEAVLFQLGAS